MGPGQTQGSRFGNGEEPRPKKKKKNFKKRQLSLFFQKTLLADDPCDVFICIPEVTRLVIPQRYEASYSSQLDTTCCPNELSKAHLAYRELDARQICSGKASDGHTPSRCSRVCLQPGHYPPSTGTFRDSTSARSTWGHPCPGKLNSGCFKAKIS